MISFARRTPMSGINQFLSTTALSTAIVIAATSTAAFAQSAPKQTAADKASEVEEVVVTGTRIVREGYEAPTPLSVLGTEQIEQNAAPNLLTMLQTMPALSGSYGTTGQIATANGGIGVQTANLRSLTAARTLVLLDGHRTVGAQYSGAPDIGSFPQQLISRVDVVTGGASAVYGSDAVAGVINFVLDKQFTGIKGEVSGGVTNYGDGKNYKVDLSTGFGFADNRGHILLSGEHMFNAGVPNNLNRPWAHAGVIQLSNPAYTATNGQPALLYSTNNGGIAVETEGGVVASGPLKGTAFGPGGVPYHFNFGSIFSNPYMIGGDWQISSIRQFNPLDASQRLENIFTRFSYDITDTINAYVQYGFTQSHTIGILNLTNIPPGALSPVIKVDNAFLPASTRAAMVALGVTSFQLGTSNGDHGLDGDDNLYITHRGVVGLEGKLEAFGTTWSWDAAYTSGRTLMKAVVINSMLTDRYKLATDAVVNPATGQIVCRVTLTDPTNPCRPWNAIGTGVNDENGPGFAYMAGPPDQERGYIAQQTYSASITGEPFSLWAGPVSLAVSFEHRHDAIHVNNDVASQNANHPVGNVPGLNGEQSVTEGALETVIPLAKGESWAQNWDFNAAVRFTGYELSGYVTTWKFGTTYQPIDDIKFRVTYSRDIRAPNLQDLFATGSAAVGSGQVIDRFQNNRAYPPNFVVSSGNPALGPEKANTTGIGVVLAPRFLEGFTASVDYWDVDINGAIQPIVFQQVMDLCYAGNTTLCGFITRDAAGNVSVIQTKPINLATLDTRGLDIEASYRTPLSTFVSDWKGGLSIHGNMTVYLRNYQDTKLSAPTNHLGENTTTTYPPFWKATLSVSYNLDPVTVTLTGRAVSAGHIDSTFIECTSGCPTSTLDHQTINMNHIGGRAYLDGNFTYKFELGESVNSEFFFTAKNMFNNNPPPANSGYFWAVGVMTDLYDRLGTVYRAGIRFKM